ncbi:wall-associated receptor kinase 5-like [Amaranthus tricolor]|uniref:wall-associated receptor kinase 5-like n=1 Tax=Amaranthus tricolor TaxID=29722 RepID=UPI0025911094|nr:wall-associated receptor kinase 5-like [Amaranthus tricolor]
MQNSTHHIHLTLIIFWILIPLITRVHGSGSSPQVIAPHCQPKCGNITIPYPFGIQEGCYFKDKGYNFKIFCNQSITPPIPTFGSNLEVLKISTTHGELHINNDISFDCYNKNKSLLYNSRWVNLETFTISSTKNILIGIGCDTLVLFSGIRHNKNYNTGCMTSCSTLSDVTDNVCNGVGCCEASLPNGVTNITTQIQSFNNHSLVPFNPCSIAFPVAKDVFKFGQRNLTKDMDFYLDNNVKVPVVFNWAIGTQNCSIAKANGNSLCKNNTICDELDNQFGYICKCLDGFYGNPYLHQGCSDIDECKEGNDCEKPEYCVNKIGGYDCKCPKNFHGNGTKTHPCISDTKPWLIPVVATSGVAGGIIILLVVGFILYWQHGERQLKQIRDTYFQQNGGFLLQQKLSGVDVDLLKIFTAQDLEIATNNYNENCIIGRGGFGIVYKGILPDNQRVAIKRSLKMDPGQVEQFINEILILSQINNRNVVKLLGCCLETEVPLLVYEYIKNGTLYDHLEDAVKATFLSWSTRLKIAVEVANVLSYLHNTISTPVIHRDMKSMNVLLDEDYTAKVADFGASRLVPEDDSQLATMVLGTWGYLDPEYMQTSELTDKSDVYSFGVVLVELLTRKRVISNDRPEIEKGLAMHFLIKIKEGRLLNILDKNIVSEGTIEQITQVANLAKCCLMLKGEDRPTMKEVAVELETISRKGCHPWKTIDASFHSEDCEALLQGFSRSDGGGCSTSIESHLYNPTLFSALDGGR